MKRAALISVSDKTGLIDFARRLVALGYDLLATSGSRSFLEENGVASISIEEYTAQKEILGGRVKTLHPKIHAGLLAKRDDAGHMKQLEDDGILPIDIAVINLYPFTQNLFSEKASDLSKMIELIDIGGPTMIRAAAKNFRSVLPIVDPLDYGRVATALEEAQESSRVSLELRRELALKVFTFTANYDLTIARYLSNTSLEGASSFAEAVVDSGSSFLLGDVSGTVLVKEQGLRYGENPHQKASFYRQFDRGAPSFEQLHGKELSFNNLLDVDAVLKMAQSLSSEKFGAVIVKHLNPCGAAYGTSAFDAIKKAKLGDPRSHFGGVIALNTAVTPEAAEDIASEFAEIVVAPEFMPDALKLLQKSKNLRILRCSMESANGFELRSVQGGFLVQETDRRVSNVREATVASKRVPSDAEMADLEFAWTMCAHVKSNAILLVKDCMILGTGAGQMSRVDSAEFAVQKAKTHGHHLAGAVAASDAFFPFPDSVEFLAANGIRAIIAPSGAKRDGEVVAACDALGVALLFAGDRHFRH